MTKSLKLPKISVKALFPSAALKHGHNETLQMRMRHNNRIARAGGRYKNLSRNPEKRIDQLLERERIRKSRKIRSLINKIDNLSDENPEEKDAISYQINEKNNSLRKGDNKKRKTKKNRKKKGGSKSCGCGSTPSSVVSYPAGSSSSMSPNPNNNISSAQQQFADSACASTGDAMGDSWSQKGGSDLGKFIESLNNMSGGRRRKSRRKKRKAKKCSKKRLSKKMICFKGPMKHLKKMRKFKTKKIRLTRCSKLRFKK